MANGQGPRRGLGIAFQGRAETPDYLLTQAQNQAQRRRQTQADLQEQQQEAQQSAMDDLGDMGDKIHPAYNPIKQRLKDEYFQRVKQVKNQTKPGRKFTNTEGYFKAKNDLQRAFKKLERSSENFRNYRDQVMKDDKVIGDPEKLDAFAKQDLNKIKQLTGNELGLFGDVPMRKYSPTDLNKNIADRLGVNETLESLEGAGGFQQMKQVISESPEASKFEQGLRAEYRGDQSLQKTAKELYGLGNEDEFVEYQMRMIPSERKVSTKRMPDQDGRGGGSDREGNIWSDIDYIVQQNKGRAADAIQQGADPEQAMSQLGQQLQMPMRVESGEPTFKSSGLQSMMAEVPAWEFAGEKLYFRDPELEEMKSAKEYEIAGDLGEDSKEFLSKNYPTRITDVSEKLAVPKEGGKYKILKMEEIRDNPDLLNKIVPVQVNEIEPFDKPPEGAAISEDELDRFNKAYGLAKDRGVEMYSVYPLNERATTEFFDNKVRTAQRFYRGGQGGQQYNPQQQEQQDNEQRSPTNPDNINEGNESPTTPSLLPK